MSEASKQPTVRHDRVDLRPGTLTAPLPPALVTVGDGDPAHDNVLTVAWTGILNSEPPRTYVSVRPSRHSHAVLSRTGEYVLHLTCESLLHATDYAGIYTGAKVNKFEKLGLTRLPSRCVKAPTLAEAPLALECRVFQTVSMGTHDVFMADILNVSVREELLDERGRLMLERAGLLAYVHGAYFSLGEELGRFGFSAARRSRSTPASAPTDRQKKTSQAGGTRGTGKPAGRQTTGSAGQQKTKKAKPAAAGQSSHPSADSRTPSGDGQAHVPFYQPFTHGAGKRRGGRR